jgi:hypothetical protein
MAAQLALVAQLAMAAQLAMIALALVFRWPVVVVEPPLAAARLKPRPTSRQSTVAILW